MSCEDEISAAFSDFGDFLGDVWDDAVEFVGSAIETIWKEIAYPIVKAIFNLFGYNDEEIQVVQAVTQPLITSSFTSGLLKAVSSAVQQEHDIVARIQHVVLSGPISSVNKYLSYGTTTYTHGLPTATMTNTTINAIEVETIIEAEEGAAIVIRDISLEVMTPTYWVASWLHNEYVFDSATGLYQLPDTLWYTYESFVDDTTPGQYVVTMSTIVNEEILPATDPKTYQDVTYYEYPVTTGHNLTGNYYMVDFEILSDLGYIRAWAYAHGSGGYPSLDTEATAGVFTQDILPIVPLRADFYSINDQNAPGYDADLDNTSRAIIKAVNFDYDDIITSIEASPEIANVEDAFFMFAVNLYTTSPAGLHALYSLFHNFYLSGGITKAQYEANPDGVNANIVMVKEQLYNSSLSYQWIEKTDVVGSIGDLGTTTSDITVLDNTLPDEFDNGGRVNSYMIIRHQYSETNYHELKVQGLFSLVSIRTVSNVFKIHTIELSTDSTEMANFSIPLSLDMIEDVSYTDKEELIYESMSLVMYAALAYDVAWYETPQFTALFSFVLQVISIVLLLVAWADSGSSSAFVWALAKQVLIQYALGLVLIELLELADGDDTAKAAAIALYVYASFKFGPKGGKGFPTAKVLLDLVTALTIDITIQLEDQEEEYALFLEEAKERQEIIDKAWAGLNTGQPGEVDPFELISSFNTSPYEGPEAFYERTVHNTNPGVAVLDVIATYHTDALTLPENSTMGAIPSPTVN